MGLEWRDIDFDKRTLEVRQASQYLPGQRLLHQGPEERDKQAADRRAGSNDRGAEEVEGQADRSGK